MLDALERHMPAGVRWAPPAAGIFVWVSLPAGADATELLRESLGDERVAFCPGRAFAVAGGRLSLAQAESPGRSSSIR
jgi:DNA-binding transcriptional MocR family regulator